MSHDIIEAASTSMATTKETEPEVVAGISSADLNPSQKLAVRVDETTLGYGSTLMLLAAGLGIGYCAWRWQRSRS